jgi:hypothetical protein
LRVSRKIYQWILYLHLNGELILIRSEIYFEHVILGTQIFTKLTSVFRITISVANIVTDFTSELKISLVEWGYVLVYLLLYKYTNQFHDSGLFLNG